METRRLPYEEAKVEVIMFESVDIITSSGNIDDDGIDDTEQY